MAKQMTADEESILKRQARRRLIGAVALVTAVVVVLPLVFDSEPPATTLNDIELRIPDKAAELTSGAAESAVSEASAVVAAPLVAAVVEPVPVAIPSAPAPVVVAPIVVPAPAALAVAPQQIQEGKIEHPKVEAAKPAKVEPKHPAEAKQKAETKPKVEAKPAAKPSANINAVPKSGFVVQVGAFSNPATAKNLQDKLGKQGLHAYTEKVGSNVRVRVGSFPTREAAEKVRHKLESQGLHPNVVNLGG